MEYLNIFIKSIFIDNMIFAYFLGMCSYLAISNKVNTSIGLGLSVIFVMIITVPLNFIIDKYILHKGALAWIDPILFKNIDLSFMTVIIFIATISTIVQLLEILIEKFSPILYNSLGIFLPLIAVNCAILGGSLFMQKKDFLYITEAFIYGLGSGIGWFLAILSLAAIREKISYSNIPDPLKGLGITFILTGLMAIGFLSFSGITI